jgi:hypothetical protein
MVCNGQGFFATQNLHVALLRLRETQNGQMDARESLSVEGVMKNEISL